MSEKPGTRPAIDVYNATEEDLRSEWVKTTRILGALPPEAVVMWSINVLKSDGKLLCTLSISDQPGSIPSEEFVGHAIGQLWNALKKFHTNPFPEGFRAEVKSQKGESAT